MTAKRFRITDNGIEDTLLKEQYPKIKKSDEVIDEVVNKLSEELSDIFKALIL